MHWLIGLLACPRAHGPGTWLHKLRGRHYDGGDILRTIRVTHHRDLQPERATILADGYPVDVIILKQSKERFSNKWNIVAGGNGEGIYAIDRYEDLTKTLGGNTIYFDYTGLKSRDALLKAARAVMKYVETQEATEITAIGASLGGGVLRQAYKYHLSEKKPEACYAFIFDRTFSRLPYVVMAKGEEILSDFLSPAAVWFSIRLAAATCWIFGWNLGSLKVSKHIQCEIVIQDTDDKVIPQSAWLGQEGEERLFKTSGYFHMNPVNVHYPTITRIVNTFFARNKIRLA